MYSWSLTNVKEVAENVNPLGFPFNQYFSFFMLSIMAFLILIPAYKFPRKYDNKVRTITDLENEKTLQSEKITDTYLKGGQTPPTMVESPSAKKDTTVAILPNSHQNPVYQDDTQV